MINRPQLRPDKNRDAHWECNAKDNEKKTIENGGEKKETAQRQSFVASSDRQKSEAKKLSKREQHTPV